MCLCLKTYGIEPFMTWPINAMKVLNLSFFFLLKGFLNTERRNNAPALTIGQDMTCFFYFFGKLTF